MPLQLGFHQARIHALKSCQLPPYFRLDRRSKRKEREGEEGMKEEGRETNEADDAVLAQALSRFGGEKDIPDFALHVILHGVLQHLGSAGGLVEYNAALRYGDGNHGRDPDDPNGIGPVRRLSRCRPPQDIFQKVAKEKWTQAVGSHLEIMALARGENLVVGSGEVFLSEALLRKWKGSSLLTNLVLLPAGGVITPALWTKTSSRSSWPRNSWADRLIEPRSAKSRCKGTRRPVVWPSSAVMSSIARRLFSDERAAT